MKVQRKAELSPETPHNICVRATFLEETEMRTLKLVCAATLLGGSLVATAASAMPVAPLPSDAVSNVESVRWVCGPYRCWWRPNYYGGYGAYAYYPYRHYGWRHRRWHRGWW